MPTTKPQTASLEFSCKSVVGGWQTLVSLSGHEALIGPVFNACADLWAWQSINLPQAA